MPSVPTWCRSQFSPGNSQELAESNVTASFLDPEFWVWDNSEVVDDAESVAGDFPRRLRSLVSSSELRYDVEDVDDGYRYQAKAAPYEPEPPKAHDFWKDFYNGGELGNPSLLANA